MELSALANQYNLPLTRSERTLVGQLSTASSAVSEDRYARNIKDMAAARDVINQLPDAQTATRQRNLAKAAMLKERLKMLRQMIQFMSPAAAKSLKTELKQIAAQLVSLQVESGGSGSATAAPQAVAAETPVSGSSAVAATDTASTGEAGKSTGRTGSEQGTSSPVVVPGDGVKRGEGSGEDRQLKETIEEMKHLLRAVLAAAKRKQQSGRGSGQLRSYAGAPDSTGSVTVMV